MKSKKIPYWKHRLHEIVYEADTPAGKRFDLILLILILLSVVLVMLESVSSIHTQYETELNIMEWVITGLFSVEYIIRLIAIKKPFSYVFSFYGIIDLLEWKDYKWHGISQKDSIPSLINGSGYFYEKKKEVIKNSNPQHIRKELQAQIDYAISIGIKPTHLDKNINNTWWS